jgi:hypothetical protein
VRTGQPAVKSESLVFLDEAGVSAAMSYDNRWAQTGFMYVIERPPQGKNVPLISASCAPRSGRREAGRLSGSINWKRRMRAWRLSPTCQGPCCQGPRSGSAQG